MIWFGAGLHFGVERTHWLLLGLCAAHGRYLVSGAGRVDSTISFRFMPILSLQMQTVTR